MVLNANHLTSTGNFQRSVELGEGIVELHEKLLLITF